MKKLVATISLLIVLVFCMFALSGCTFKLETSDNSVTASVDGDTTEKVDNILDWIKLRIRRLFNNDDSGDTSGETTTDESHVA